MGLGGVVWFLLCKDGVYTLEDNSIFNHEMKYLKHMEFKLITQLRTGHNHLNSQRKWGNEKLCKKINCDKNETLIHILFECMENRNDRNDLLFEIQKIYGNEINLANMNNENKLKYFLFPFCNAILDKKKMKDKNIKKQIYEKRLKILNKIYNFCKNSGRFDDLFDYKFNIKTW